ncbi:MAG: hypothetical protein Q8M34_01255 [Thermodesulfovibrionales bacterium]|nr:hypothetical protein [Thermodesulfovibrionales bacterium]
MIDTSEMNKMEQPYAKVTLEDIERIVKRDYPYADSVKIFEILNKYTIGEKYRVWAAALKLSDKDITKLEEHIKIAIHDYRDVIAYAEYPEYSRKVGFNSDKITKEEIAEIYNRDWTQYKKWLQ